jgi:hypothetical protein
MKRMTEAMRDFGESVTGEVHPMRVYEQGCLMQDPVALAENAHMIDHEVKKWRQEVFIASTQRALAVLGGLMITSANMNASADAEQSSPQAHNESFDYLGDVR